MIECNTDAVLKFKLSNGRGEIFFDGKPVPNARRIEIDLCG